nr:unnamed protein product [Callosobruchus analis]
MTPAVMNIMNSTGSNVLNREASLKLEVIPVAGPYSKCQHFSRRASPNLIQDICKSGWLCKEKTEARKQEFSSIATRFGGRRSLTTQDILNAPLPSGNLNVEKTIFNKRLSRATVTIECAFAILSNKWRVSLKAIETYTTCKVNHKSFAFAAAKIYKEIITTQTAFKSTMH